MASATDARHITAITPPNGFPFIVLPPLDTPAEQEPPPPSRRRLAVNVIAMFEDERPSVPVTKRRGRLPRNVISIRSQPRLKPGVIAELCGGAHPDNIGKRVKVLGVASGSDLPPGQWWRIQSVSQPLVAVDTDTGRPSGNTRMELVTRAENLRRCLRLLPKGSA